MRKISYSWLVVGLIMLAVLSSAPMALAQTLTASITVDVNQGPDGKLNPVPVNYGVLGTNMRANRG
ncbi:MAG: hypothetical protein HZB30_11400 [Nitrospirae bacterium]|nr:hypothetical protein [Nitrospirota bacterium]